MTATATKKDTTKSRLRADVIPSLIAQGGMHADGGSLYLVVRGDRAAWVFQQRRAGVLKSHGLGPYPATSLQQARKARDVIAASAPARTNPAHVLLGLTSAPAQPASVTFGEAASIWLEKFATAWGPEEHARKRALLRLHAGDLNDKPVNAITTTEIGDLLREGWRGPASGAKSKLRGVIEGVLASQEIDPNPASWKRLKSHLTKGVKTVSVASLPYAKVPELMTKLTADKREGVKAIRFLILTGVRLNEALGAQWSEIDLAAKTWTIPASRMKMRVEHVVPLSDAALAVLGERGEGFVFPGRDKGHIGENVAQKRLKQIWTESHCTLHGMRSSFTDWAAEIGGYEGSDLPEYAIAHKVVKGSNTAYKRTKLIELRRPLMEEWARFAVTKS